jgi:hypothetical protein
MNEEIMYAPEDMGGRNLLDIVARNEAITITWLKSYLSFGDDHPLWAFVEDELLAKKAQASDANVDELLRYNTYEYLQTWNIKSAELSTDLAAMVEAARDNGLGMEGLAISRGIQRSVVPTQTNGQLVARSFDDRTRSLWKREQSSKDWGIPDENEPMDLITGQLIPLPHEVR